MRQGHIGVYDEGNDAGSERRRVGGRGSRCEYSRTMLKAIHATSHVFGAGYTTQQALILAKDLISRQNSWKGTRGGRGRAKDWRRDEAARGLEPKPPNEAAGKTRQRKREEQAGSEWMDAETLCVCGL